MKKKYVTRAFLIILFISLSAITVMRLNYTPSSVAKKLLPSVVCIQNYTVGKDGKEVLISEGSGFIISKDGYIATNAHVVRDAESISIISYDGKNIPAEIIGSDISTDLAVIKANINNPKPVSIDKKPKINSGDYVIAIGSPGGNSFLSSVSFGIISGKREIALSEFSYTLSTIQTDTAINPGNSGGPLVDMHGDVIGICSAKLARDNFEGMGFAISIDEAMPVLSELMLHGKVEGRSVLGVSGFYLNKSAAESFGKCTGFYIEDVKNPSASFLCKGDVITKIDDIEVSSATMIKDMALKKNCGESVIIEFYSCKDEKLHTAKISLISEDEL